MKKGFTLIEMLAIIIVLAAIVMVAAPTINGILKDSEIGNDKAMIRTLVDETTMMYDSHVLKNTQNEIENINIYSLLETSNFTQGEVYINEYGNIALAILIENRCYIKQYNGDIEYVETSNCNL